MTDLMSNLLVGICSWGIKQLVFNSWHWMVYGYDEQFRQDTIQLDVTFLNRHFPIKNKLVQIMLPVNTVNAHARSDGALSSALTWHTLILLQQLDIFSYIFIRVHALFLLHCWQVSRGKVWLHPSILLQIILCTLLISFMYKWNKSDTSLVSLQVLLTAFVTVHLYANFMMTFFCTPFVSLSGIQLE